MRVHHYILMCVLHHMICFNGVAAWLKPFGAIRSFMFLAFRPGRGSGQLSVSSSRAGRRWPLDRRGAGFARRDRHFLVRLALEKLLLLFVVSTVASAGLGGGGSQRYAQPVL